MPQLRKAQLNNWKAMKMIKLTNRQEQVLSLVAQGRTDKEIAGLLFISAKTVDFHMSCILRTLNARSRAHACCIRFAPTDNKNQLRRMTAFFKPKE